MTRMLWKFLIVALAFTLTSGCSLFSSDEGGAPSEIDTESVSGDVVLDAEDEMLEESADLAGAADDFGGDGFDDAASAEPEPGSQDALDEEFSEASLGGDDAGSGDEFSDAGLDDEFSDEGSDFSDTGDNQVDQQLAQDELGADDFSEFGDAGDAGQDEFALESDLTDEPPLDDLVSDNAPMDGASDNQITNLQYKAFENGGTVVIETSSPAQFQKIVDPELNQVVIQVNDVFLPEKFKRPYVTKDFKQDIATINAYSDESGAARFVIQMKRPIEPSVQQEGNSILVMTAGGAAMTQAKNGSLDADPYSDSGPAEQPLDQLVSENQMEFPDENQDPLSPSFNVKNQPRTTRGGITRSGSQDKLASSFGGQEKSGLSLGVGSFSGEKINLEFNDEEVRTIIEVISERSGVNLIMDKEVEGKTSIKLRDVPWDQALLVLLRSQGLGYVKQGSVLRIAKQATLSQEAQAVSSQIQSEKQAKLLSGGIKVKYIPVSYADVKDLSGKLKDFTSKDGKIAFDDRTSSLVITDYGEYIDRIVDLVKALDTAPMQVEIESKLVEARETFIREAGINWELGGQPFSFGDQTATIGNSLAGTLPGNGYTLDLNIGTFDIFGDLTAALSVFESSDKIKVVSQPRILTMNKVKAEIKQTLQVPVTETLLTPGAPAQQTFRFLDVVLGLAVTPQITFKGDVILEVDVQRDFAGAILQTGAREINKRSAKSTVMVKNGKTAVIGGIYQLDDGELETGIPLLKDIPLLGNLFKQNRDEKIKSELLLFLKPKILKEVDGPLVTKAADQKNYDAFEQLSLDEGKQTSELDQPQTEESSSAFEGQGEDDGGLEEGDSFEDELESLSL